MMKTTPKKIVNHKKFIFDPKEMASNVSRPCSRVQERLSRRNPGDEKNWADAALAATGEDDDVKAAGGLIHGCHLDECYGARPKTNFKGNNWNNREDTRPDRRRNEVGGGFGGQGPKDCEPQQPQPLIKQVRGGKSDLRNKLNTKRLSMSYQSSDSWAGYVPTVELDQLDSSFVQLHMQGDINRHFNSSTNTVTINNNNYNNSFGTSLQFKVVQKSQNRLYNRVSKINNNNNNNCSSGPENLITQTSNVIDADVSDNNLNVDKTVYFNKSVRPEDCICLRPIMLIVCKICWKGTEGRIRKDCRVHPDTTYLMDMSSCPTCLTNDLVEYVLPGKLKRKNAKISKKAAAAKAAADAGVTQATN